MNDEVLSALRKVYTKARIRAIRSSEAWKAVGALRAKATNPPNVSSILYAAELALYNESQSDHLALIAARQAMENHK